MLRHSLATLEGSNICHQFLSISYLSNSEYWSQTPIQSGNIHSIKFDVYAEKLSVTNPSFIFELSSSSNVKEGVEFFLSFNLFRQKFVVVVAARLREVLITPLHV